MFLYENVGLTNVEDLAILIYGHHGCTPEEPQILDSSHIVVLSRCHRNELRRRHDVLVSFIMTSCGKFFQMTSIIARSKNEILTTVLRRGWLGIRYQHELLFRNTIGNCFDMPKIVWPLTVLLTKPYTLSQRSYDGTKCPYEWIDIVTIRTEFDFVIIRVSILLQYRDSVTPA